MPLCVSFDETDLNYAYRQGTRVKNSWTEFDWLFLWNRKKLIPGVSYILSA